MMIRVNGEEIPPAAVEFEYNRLVKFYSDYMPAEQIRAQSDLLRSKAVDQAIGAKLLMLEAVRLDIRVAEDDIDARLAEMKQAVGGDEAFETMLAKQGLFVNVVRDSIRRGRKVDLLVERITSGVSDPTEEELMEHFKGHQAEYARPDQAQVQHILLRPASDRAEDREVARSRLMEIRNRIRNGAVFADEAAVHSECPSGRKTGGSLGWVSRGMMVRELDEAAFAMSVGELSEVIESSLGMHLLIKSAERAGGPAEFTEVRERVREFLRHVKRGQVLTDYVQDLRQKAVIEKD
jgi:parvulin-like peptidyl-prolyl isomerase